MKYQFYFDIDKTLVTIPKVAAYSFYLALKELFLGMGTFQDFLDSAAFANGAIDSGVFIKIAKKLEQSGSKEQWDGFIDRYHDFLETSLKQKTAHYQIHEGVKDLLKFLKKKNQILRLFTGNTKQGAFLKLKYCELGDYFDWENSVFAEYPQMSKADFKNLLLLKIAQHPEPAIFIGDTFHDIQLAHAVGGISIAVASGFYSLEDLKEHRPHHCLKSLKDFTWLNFV